MIGGFDGDVVVYVFLFCVLLLLFRSFYCWCMFVGFDDIEDFVQEMLIVVYICCGIYDCDCVFVVWLFVIVCYKMIDQFCCNWCIVLIEGLEDMLVVEGFEEVSIVCLDIEDLLLILLVKQVCVICVIWIDGVSVVEVVNVVGIGEFDVKVLVYCGLKVFVVCIVGYCL